MRVTLNERIPKRTHIERCNLSIVLVKPPVLPCFPRYDGHGKAKTSLSRSVFLRSLRRNGEGMRNELVEMAFIDRASPKPLNAFHPVFRTYRRSSFGKHKLLLSFLSCRYSLPSLIASMHLGGGKDRKGCEEMRKNKYTISSVFSS